MGKNRFEVIRVDYGIASISPFKIDIPLYNESIQFGAKIT